MFHVLNPDSSCVSKCPQAGQWTATHWPEFLLNAWDVKAQNISVYNCIIKKKHLSAFIAKSRAHSCVFLCSGCMAYNPETLVCCWSVLAVHWVIGLCPQPAEFQPTQIYKVEDQSSSCSGFNLLGLWWIWQAEGLVTPVRSAHIARTDLPHWIETRGEIIAKLENWSVGFCSSSLIS